MTNLDAIYEAAVADDWEEQNRKDFPEWGNAIKEIRKCVNWLKDAVKSLNEAADMVVDSTEDDRILSLSSEIEFLASDLTKQAERMERDG